MRIFLLVVGLWLCGGALCSQVLTKVPKDYNSLLLLLQDYEINEEDFYQMVLKNGVDLNTVNLNDPKQYEALKPLLIESLSSFEELPEWVLSKPSKMNVDTTDPRSGDLEYPLTERDSSEIAELKREPDTNQLYLHDLFRRDRVSREGGTNDPRATEDYVLGPGDEITVSIWGRSVYQKRLTVTSYGDLEFEDPPLRLAVSGLEVRQARELVRGYLQRYFQFDKDEFSLLVRSARSLRVSIYGEVREPGTYTIPATFSIVDILSLADGPTDLATLREIVVVKGGRTDTIDMYSYFGNPSMNTNLGITENTLVTVLSRQKRIQISGEISRPGFYDLLPEEGILDLVRYAGGMNPTAYKQKVQIRRFLDQQMTLLDIDLEQAMRTAQNIPLQAGDHVRLPSILQEVDDRVTVEGAVFQAGEFAWEEGITVDDILKRAGLMPNTRRDLAYIARKTIGTNVLYERIHLLDLGNSAYGKMKLRAGDKLVILDNERYVNDTRFLVSGAIRDTGSFAYDEESSLRVTDALELAGGVLPQASGLVFVVRIDEEDPLGKVFLRVDLEAIANGDSSQNVPIKAGDSLYVEDAAEFYSEAFVEIAGEVNRPGRFQYDPNMGLRDLIYLASGYTPRATRNRIDVYRLRFAREEGNETFLERVEYDPLKSEDDSFVLRPYDRVVVRNIKNYRLQRMVKIEGEVNYPGSYALIGENQTLRDVIQQAGGLTAEAFPSGATLYRKLDSVGYIVMKLDQAIKNPKSAYNYTMREDDVLFIPRSTEFVAIKGAVNASQVYPEKFINSDESIKVPFDGSRSAKYYIDNYAAGISDVGDKRLVSVEYSNGQVRSTRGFLFFRTYPKVESGSVIHVGYKVPKPLNRKDKEPIDWGRLVGQTLAQATAVLSIVLLVRELNN